MTSPDVLLRFAGKITPFPKEAKAAMPDHPPAIEWKHHWPPSRVAPDHPIVSAACSAHELAHGESPQVVGWCAVHDGTFLNQAGVPAISYGPGDVRQAHAVDERVSVDELVRACKTYALLAVEWCGVS